MVMNKPAFILFPLLFTCCFIWKGMAQVPETFKKVDSSLVRSNKLLDDFLRDLDSVKKLNTKQSAAALAYEKAGAQLNGLKEALRKKPEDDMKYPNQLFFTKGEGKKLYVLLINYKRKILAALHDSTSRQKIHAWLNTEIPKNEKKSWAEYYFRNLPAVAALTMLSKIQNDIRNCQVLLRKEIMP
jgi:GldM N-terminal domain